MDDVYCRLLWPGNKQRFTSKRVDGHACLVPGDVQAANPTGGQAKTRLAPWLPGAAGSRAG